MVNQLLCLLFRGKKTQVYSESKYEKCKNITCIYVAVKGSQTLQIHTKGIPQFFPVNRNSTPDPFSVSNTFQLCTVTKKSVKFIAQFCNNLLGYKEEFSVLTISCLSSFQAYTRFFVFTTHALPLIKTLTNKYILVSVTICTPDRKKIMLKRLLCVSFF